MTTIPTDGQRPGLRILWSPVYRRQTLTISLGLGLHAFNEYSVAPVLPVALTDLGDLPFLPWAYALFFCGVIAGGVTSSAMRAKLGARNTALLSAFLYALAILINTTSLSGEQLLLGRLLQGLADGWLAALCYSLIPEAVTAALVGTLIAFETIVWAGTAVLGPSIGGAATDLLGWRVGLGVSLPIIIIFTIAAAMIFPPTRGKAAVPMRLGHFGTVFLCIASILIMVLPSALPSGTYIPLAIPLGAAILTLLMRHDAKRDAPLFPRQIFRLTDSVGLGGLVLLLITAGLSISTIFMAYAVQTIFGVPSRVVGLVVLCMPLAWTLTAIPVGNVRRPTLQRKLFTIGPVCQIAGAVLIILGLTHAQLNIVFLGQIVIGLGLGTVWGPVMDAMLAAANEQDRGRVGALLPSTTTVGYVLGSGVGGWVATHFGMFHEDGPPSTSIVALWSTMILFASAALALIQKVQPSAELPPHQ